MASNIDGCSVKSGDSFTATPSKAEWDRLKQQAHEAVMIQDRGERDRLKQQASAAQLTKQTVGANDYQVKPAQQGWQCCVCRKGNAPFSAICGNPVCGLDFSNVR